MALKPYFHDLKSHEKKRLADACKTTVGQLRNVADGFNTCSILLAARLERESMALFGKHRMVQRADLIPADIFAEVWPKEAKPRKKAEA
jgi:hypothetical protein